MGWGGVGWGGVGRGGGWAHAGAFTYHLHVSMPVHTDYSCAPVGKETPVSLCSCTPCEGIHAEVTSQRGSGAPGKARCASHK